jgi:hypothetical protein
VQWQNPVELHKLVEKEIEMGQPIDGKISLKG